MTVSRSARGYAKPDLPPGRAFCDDLRYMYDVAGLEWRTNREGWARPPEVGLGASASGSTRGYWT